MSKNIGFMSYWGWGRGQAYLNLCFAKMLKDDFNVHILKLGNNEDLDEFKISNVTITQSTSQNVSPSAFEKWITDNKLDAVVFSEYRQWEETEINLTDICRKLGVKAYGNLVIERFQQKQAKDYDRLLATSVSFERVMRKNKVRNFTYVPFSIDLKEFPIKEKKENEKFIFFHPGGWGGVHNRKNTEAVIQAFIALNREDTELIITSQKKLEFMKEIPDNIKIIDKNLPRQELIDLYYKADATLLPSKWETIGLPILESLASGTPVITSDVLPMNEFVNDCLNGYLVKGTFSNFDGIAIEGINVNIDIFKNKMDLILNKDLYKILQGNSRKIIEEIYNLEKNKKYFIEFLKGELNG